MVATLVSGSNTENTAIDFECAVAIGRFVLANASSIVLSRCWSSPLEHLPAASGEVPRARRRLDN